jgi:hypothetical protein
MKESRGLREKENIAPPRSHLFPQSRTQIPCYKVDGGHSPADKQSLTWGFYKFCLKNCFHHAMHIQHYKILHMEFFEFYK